MFSILHLADCLPLFHVVIFLEFLPFFSIGTYFFVSSFWLLCCVCFYVLSRSAIFFSLDRVALCSGCPLGPSDIVSLFTWSGYSRGVLYVGCMCLPAVVDPWFLLACQWMGLPLRLTAVKIGPNHSLWAAVCRLAPWSSICSRALWRPLRLSFGCAACRVNWVVLFCVW